MMFGREPGSWRNNATAYADSTPRQLPFLHDASWPLLHPFWLQGSGRTRQDHPPSVGTALIGVQEDCSLYDMLFG